MAIFVLTVVKKDDDASHAGSLLFNSNRLGTFKTINTDNTIFEYFEDRHNRKAHMNKYEVDEAVAVVAAKIAVNNKLVYALTSYCDSDYSTSGNTEVIYISTDEIAKGAAYGADSTKSWLWVEKSPGKVVKYLVNKLLGTIADYVNTGSTTTTTTS